MDHVHLSREMAVIAWLCAIAVCLGLGLGWHATGKAFRLVMGLSAFGMLYTSWASIDMQHIEQMDAVTIISVKILLLMAFLAAPMLMFNVGNRIHRVASRP